MAGNNEVALNIDITAKDEASKVIDGITKKAEGLEKLEPEIGVDADTKAAEKSIDGVTKDAKAARRSSTPR